MAEEVRRERRRQDERRLKTIAHYQELIATDFETACAIDNQELRRAEFRSIARYYTEQIYLEGKQHAHDVMRRVEDEHDRARRDFISSRPPTKKSEE